MSRYWCFFIMNKEGDEYWNSIEGAKCPEARNKHHDATYSQDPTHLTLGGLASIEEGSEHHKGYKWWFVEIEGDV